MTADINRLLDEYRHAIEARIASPASDYMREDEQHARAAIIAAWEGREAWLPIHTAPKNGTILCLDNYGPQVWAAHAYWQSIAKDAPPKLPITEAKAVTKWCAIPPWADAARTEGKGNG